MSKVQITDHALLRYLERVGGFDVEALRRDIADRVNRIAPPGTAAVMLDGYRFVIRENEYGRSVATILPRGGSPNMQGR